MYLPSVPFAPAENSGVHVVSQQVDMFAYGDATLAYWFRTHCIKDHFAGPCLKSRCCQQQTTGSCVVQLPVNRVDHRCTLLHRGQSWGLGDCDPRDPPDFGLGFVGSLWNIIISYNVQEYEMKTLSEVVTFLKKKDLCISNENSGDDTHNPVLRASFCWTFRTYDPQILYPDLGPPVFEPDWRWRRCSAKCGDEQKRRFCNSDGVRVHAFSYIGQSWRSSIPFAYSYFCLRLLSSKRYLRLGLKWINQYCYACIQTDIHTYIYIYATGLAIDLIRVYLDL